MANEELLVTLGVQDKGATTQLKALNKELKSLDTQYKLSAKSGDGFDNSLDGLQKKLGLLDQKMAAQTAKLKAYQKQMDTARQGIAKKEQELQKLKAAGDANTASIQKAEKQLNTYRNQLKNAENGVKETEAQLELLTKEIKDTNNAINKFSANRLKQQLDDVSDKIHDVSNNFNTVGGHLNGFGNTMIGLSAPMLAFAGYATKVSMDFEAAMSNVQAISGATGDDLARLEAMAKEMGKSTSKSATDAANAFSYMALAGWDTEQMLAGIEPILRLAEAGNLDLALASDLTTDSLSALGLTAQDTQLYLDTLADAQASSNTTAQALMEAYIACGGTMKGLNVSLQESSAWLGVLANRGKKGSEAGNALNSILINLTSGAGAAGEAMDALGISAFDSNGKFVGIEETLRRVKNATKDLSDEKRNMYLSMIGGKTQIDTLNALLAGLDEEYKQLKADLSDVDGELNKMAETMQNNTKGNIEKLKSALEGLGIQVGEKLLPHINDLIEGLSGLIEWFGSLDEETQQAIVRFGLFTAASGGALKATGSLTQGIGDVVGGLGDMVDMFRKSDKNINTTGKGIDKLVGLFGQLGLKVPVVAGGVLALGAGVYAYNEYQDAMNHKVTTAAEEMSFMERAMLSLNGQTATSRNRLEKMGLVYKDFNSNISPEFQKKIKSITSDIHNFGISLSEISLDGVFSKEEKNKLTANVEEALQSALSTIESKKSSMQEGLKEAFAFDGKIDNTDLKLINWSGGLFDKDKKEAESHAKEINKILAKAFAEGRMPTAEEEKAIRDRYNKIKMIEAEASVSNNYELEYIQHDFNARMKRADAETAAELLKQRYKSYEEENIAIEAKFETLISTAKEGYSSLSDEDKKNADEMIERLEKSKQEQLEKNREYWDNAVQYTIEGNKNLEGVINKYNGEILKGKDKAHYEEFEKVKQHYAGLETITKDGLHTVYNANTETWEYVYATVDEKTGNLTGLYSHNSKELFAMTDEDAKNLRKLQNEWQLSAEQIEGHNLLMSAAYIDSSNQIISKSGEVIAKLIEQKDEAGNVSRSIQDLNGNPIDLSTNADAIIEDLKEANDQVKVMDESGATVNLKLNDEGVNKVLQETNNNQKKINETKSVAEVNAEISEADKKFKQIIKNQKTINDTDSTAEIKADTKDFDKNNKKVNDAAKKTGELKPTPTVKLNGADKAVTAANNVKKSIDNIPSSKTITLTTKEVKQKAAIGTNSSKEGMYTVNEKGWELIDAPQGRTAFALGSSFEGDSAYLPRGTRVRTHLASTEMMISEIKSEVARQLKKIDLDARNYTRSGYNAANINRIASEAVETNSNGSNMDTLEELMRSMITILATQNDLIKNNNNHIISINGRSVATATAPYMVDAINTLNNRKNRLGGK